jgi:hypothetical protein
MNSVIASQRFAAGGARRASQSNVTTPSAASPTSDSPAPPRGSISSVEDGFHTADEDEGGDRGEEQRSRELEARRHENERGEGREGRQEEDEKEREFMRKAAFAKVSEGVAELEL